MITTSFMENHYFPIKENVYLDLEEALFAFSEDYKNRELARKLDSLAIKFLDFLFPSFTVSGSKPSYLRKPILAPTFEMLYERKHSLDEDNFFLRYSFHFWTSSRKILLEHSSENPSHQQEKIPLITACVNDISGQRPVPFLPRLNFAPELYSQT